MPRLRLLPILMGICFVLFFMVGSLSAPAKSIYLDTKGVQFPAVALEKNNSQHFLLSPPRHVLPADGSSVSGTSITFQWEASPGAMNYWIQVRPTHIYVDYVYKSVGNTTSYTWNNAPNDGTEVMWQVMAENPSGSSHWSGFWYFNNSPGTDSADKQKAERLFGWIESQLPDLFSPPGQPVEELEGILFRYYGVSDYFLATFEGHFFWIVGVEIIHLGTVDEWLAHVPSEAGCPSARISWSNGQCESSVPSTAHDLTHYLTNQRSGFTGSIVVRCNDGEWVGHSGGDCNPTGSGDVTTEGIEREIFNQTNDNRRNYQRSALSRDPQLDQIARNYAMQIARDGKWGHWNIQARFDQGFALGYNMLGENEWKGTNISESTNYAFGSRVVNAWMNSQGHRENILKTEFTHIGVGFAKVGNETAAVQFFGRR